MDPERNDSLLRVEDLTKSFTSRQGLAGSRVVAVDRVRFELPSTRPEILTLAGESGSGKTTLGRMIMGMIEPSAGHLYFMGRDVSRMPAAERQTWFRPRVQPIFQDPFATFNPLRRVETYLYETALNYRVAKHATADEQVDRALGEVGLSLKEVKGRYPNELSGGQLQRISIARALITRPSLLVADEPVSMLDASLRMSVVNLFRRLKQQQSVIYITHDLATAYYASDRVAIMLRGWVVELGPVEKVLGTPLHPYTQLLKSSILEPDPTRKTRLEVPLSAGDVRDDAREGCRFASRCPRVLDVCRRVAPRDTIVDGRMVKCHLFGDSDGHANGSGPHPN